MGTAQRSVAFERGEDEGRLSKVETGRAICARALQLPSPAPEPAGAAGATPASSRRSFVGRAVFLTAAAVLVLVVLGRDASSEENAASVARGIPRTHATTVVGPSLESAQAERRSLAARASAQGVADSPSGGWAANAPGSASKDGSKGGSKGGGGESEPSNGGGSGDARAPLVTVNVPGVGTVSVGEPELRAVPELPAAPDAGVFPPELPEVPELQLP